jgi:NADH-quinone oxidoreductase subunit N
VLAWLGAVATAGAAAAAIVLGPGAAESGSSLARDGASAFFVVLVAAVTGAALVLAAADPRRGRSLTGDEVALALFSASGATLMIGAADLLVLLAGLALFSLPLHLLAGRGSARQLAMAATALALVAYGAALLYTAAGETAYAGLGRATRNPLYLSGLALTLAGLAFHAALAPFHSWSISLHASERASVSALVAIVGKVAAFVALMRLAGVTRSGEAGLDWEVSFAMLAALGVAIGSLAPLTEHRVKRLLAYASVAQAAYVAIAVAAFAGPASAFALAVDAVLLLGAFGVAALASAEDPTLDDLAGLARRRPLVVLALGVILLGLAGLPPTAGFLARLYVFEVAVRAQLLWLVVIGALAGVASVAYCLRVFLACFAAPRLDAVAPPRSRLGTAVVLLAAIAVIAIGVVPGPLLDAAQAVRF